jgi:hypothetical protein
MSIFKRGQDSNKSDCDVVRRMGSTIILETEGQTFDGADRFATDTDKTTIKYTDCHCTRVVYTKILWQKYRLKPVPN